MRKKPSHAAWLGGFKDGQRLLCSQPRAQAPRLRRGALAPPVTLAPAPSKLSRGWTWYTQLSITQVFPYELVMSFSLFLHLLVPPPSHWRMRIPCRGTT